MASAVSDAFTFLHSQLKAAFGTGKKAWFKATRAASTYTVGAECVESPMTAKAISDMGFVAMPDDAIVLHVTASEMPYEPRPDDLFILGTSASSGRNTRRRYQPWRSKQRMKESR